MRSLLPAPAWVHEFVSASMDACEASAEHAQTRLQSLKERGRDRCPRCTNPLDLEGYRRTQTSYLTEEVLTCPHCQQGLLLSRLECV